VGITNATCPNSLASPGTLTCTVTGNTAANILDLNYCSGAIVTCGGGSDIVINATHSVTNAGCGI
jgi:hypothetical protein